MQGIWHIFVTLFWKQNGFRLIAMRMSKGRGASVECCNQLTSIAPKARNFSNNTIHPFPQQVFPKSAFMKCPISNLRTYIYKHIYVVCLDWPLMSRAPSSVNEGTRMAMTDWPLAKSVWELLWCLHAQSRPDNLHSFYLRQQQTSSLFVASHHFRPHCKA